MPGPGTGSRPGGWETLLYVTLLHFSHDRSSWSSPSFSSTTFQNFPGISHLRPEVSKFHHHTKLRSKCSTLLVSCSNLRPICWWKNSLRVVECCLCYGNPGYISTCTYCVTCRNATQISWSIPHYPHQYILVVECCLCYGNPWYSSTCTYCVTCHNATQISWSIPHYPAPVHTKIHF